MTRLFTTLCYLIAAWHYRVARAMTRQTGSPYWRTQKDLAHQEREDYARELDRMSINFI